MLNDAEFLNWVADRLVHVYGESPHVDFVHKLRAIADAIGEQTTPNVVRPVVVHGLSEEKANEIADAIFNPETFNAPGIQYRGYIPDGWLRPESKRE